jgi:hypothetical protein
MRYDIFYTTLPNIQYAFSVDVKDEEQLVEYLTLKWIMSNQTDFLEKTGSMTDDAATILKRLRTYSSKDTANCIIVCETDSCFKTFEDIICEQGGWHIFKPVAWNFPDRDQLVDLTGKYLYHPVTNTFWIDTAHGPIMLLNPETIKSRGLAEIVAEMGL